MKKISPREAEIKARNKVLKMFPKDGSLVKWTTLEKQARNLGMSLRTLSKKLKELEEYGRVRRVVRAEEKPPGVYYQYIDPLFFKAIYDELPSDIANLGLWMRNLEKLKGHPARILAAEAIVKLRLFLVTSELINIWGKALMLPNDKAAVGFIRTMMEDYIYPDVNNMGLLLRVHNDIADKVLDKALEKILKGTDDIEKLLERVKEQLVKG